MKDEAEKEAPTWGYHQTEPARIFPTAKLPKGWVDTPAKLKPNADSK